MTIFGDYIMDIIWLYYKFYHNSLSPFSYLLLCVLFIKFMNEWNSHKVEEFIWHRIASAENFGRLPKTGINAASCVRALFGGGHTLEGARWFVQKWLFGIMKKLHNHVHILNVYIFLIVHSIQIKHLFRSFITMQYI